MLVKSYESIEYSYIGRADFFFFFFSGNSIEICSRSVFIFRGLTFDFFISSVHFLCNKKGKFHYRTAKM